MHHNIRQQHLDPTILSVICHWQAPAMLGVVKLPPKFDCPHQRPDLALCKRRLFPGSTRPAGSMTGCLRGKVHSICTLRTPE